MKLTPRQINAAFYEAFGRNANSSELSYWGNKEDIQLRDALIADTRTGGKYADLRNQKTQPTSTANTTPTAQPLSYEDWLNSPAGGEYRKAMTPEEIAKSVSPYYERQLSAEEYARGLAGEDYARAREQMIAQKGLAYQDLLRNKSLTTEATGESANDAGLYGSGIYQKELGRQLGDLQTTYNRNWVMGSSPYRQGLFNLETSYNRDWGTGEYTPYSMRRFDILNQKKASLRTEKDYWSNLAEGAYNRYLQALAPGT